MMFLSNYRFDTPLAIHNQQPYIEKKIRFDYQAACFLHQSPVTPNNQASSFFIFFSLFSLINPYN